MHLQLIISELDSWLFSFNLFSCDISDFLYALYLIIISSIEVVSSWAVNEHDNFRFSLLTRALQQAATSFSREYKCLFEEELILDIL